MLRVPDGAAGTRLDRFLAGAVGSRARAQSLIDAGRVRVDGAVVPKRHLVRAGEAVEFDDSPPESSENLAGGPAPYEVAYEDQHLLVVDKPAGVVVHPARGHWDGTLAQALEGQAAGGGEPWRAGGCPSTRARYSRRSRRAPARSRPRSGATVAIAS